MTLVWYRRGWSEVEQPRERTGRPSKVELDYVCVQEPSRVWWADSGWKMRRKTKGPTFDNTLKAVVERDWLDYPVGIRQEALKRTELPPRLEQQTQDEDEDSIMKKR